ncbi:Rv2732c family membrane protein [Crossiella sp. NPDC003009]
MRQPMNAGAQDGRDDMAEFAEELKQVERRVVRRVEPAPRSAMVIAGAVLVLLVSALLPWVGDAAGWQVLLGQTDPALKIGVLPRLFGGFAVFFGVLLTAATLSLRLWALAWVSTLGCWLSVMLGLLSVWTRQTVFQAPGPGAGLYVAVLPLVVLGIQWFRLAWSRP